jgi:hypothetical protein
VGGLPAAERRAESSAEEAEEVQEEEKEEEERPRGAGGGGGEGEYDGEFYSELGMQRIATSVCGLKQLVYEALRY